MKNIFELSKDIKEMAIYQQKKTKGGHWGGTTTLPTIIIPPGGPDPSFYWSWGDFSFSDPGFSYGGGGGIGGGDSDSPTNQGDINDPHNMMDFTENYLKDNLEATKNLIDNGAIDPIKGKALMDAYQKGLDILDMLKDSGKNYRFDVNPDYHQDGKKPGAATTYDSNTNEYVVTIPGAPSQYFGLLIHELEHLNQIENGELSFDKNGNFSDYDVMDEVNAYQFQEYIEKGPDYKIITPDDVLNMKDKDGTYIYEHFRTLGTGNNNGPGVIIGDWSSFSRS